MLIRVPFYYRATFVMKGKRKPESDQFWEWLDVEIPELDDFEAPVALRWRDETPGAAPGFADFHRWGLFPSDGICESRWFQDSHWMPVLVEDRNTRSSAERMTTEDFLRMCTQGDHYGNPLAISFHRGAADNLNGNPFNPDDYRSVSECGRDTEVAKIIEQARNLIFADGAVWRRCAEPVCYLKEWVNYGHSYQAAIKILPSDSKDIKEPSAVYRVDRFDEAAEAAVLRDSDHGNVDLMNMPRRVDVFVPESVRYRDEEKALDHSVGRLLAHYADKPIKEFHADVAAGWFVLRDAYEMDGDRRLEAVETALEEFIHVIPARSDKLADARRTLERWQSRPISIPDEHAEAVTAIRPR